MPEIVHEGTDVTIVTYGSTLRIVQDALATLNNSNINCELVDVQTLLPFDINEICAQSLKKTSKLLVVDEDVPGGASAYILQQVLENQKGYYYLDGQPKTLTAKAHRPPYGSDGDYFTKPSVEDVVETVYAMMHDSKPNQFPAIF